MAPLAGELEGVIPRSARIFDMFRYAVVLVMVLGGILAIMVHFDRVTAVSMTRVCIICIFIVLATVYGRGSISIVYVWLLKWVLQHLHTTEDHRWVIALGITALCDVFLNALNMIAYIVLSVLSMIMICIVAAGWDCDRSGMTEGLLIGFGKLLLVHLIKSELLPSILCGVVLVLAIASKLSEHPAEATTGNPIHVGNANSTQHTAKV